MALAGGAADKLGNRYELWWTVLKVMDVLRGDWDAIRLEQPGVEKAEFVLRGGTKKSLHQAKRQAPDGKWTLSELSSKDNQYLQAIGEQLQDANVGIVFVSGSDAPELVELAARARDSISDEEFETFFVQGKKHQSGLQHLQKIWGDCDVSTARNYLRRIEVRVLDERSLVDQNLMTARVLFQQEPRDACLAIAGIVLDSVHRDLSRTELVDSLARAGYSLRQGADAQLLQKTLDATSEATTNWSRRLQGRPIIDLRLIRLDDKGNETPEITRRTGLTAELTRNGRVEIQAPAGRGKTTTLVELARELRLAGRIACLIDLPAWIRSNKDILEFLAGMTEFRSRGLTADALAQVQQASPIIFLLNGWNELALSESTNAAGMIRTLARSYVASGIAVATRAHPVAVPLSDSTHYRIQALTRAERDDYLRERLEDKAIGFSAQLAGDKVLDSLTRTPLILAEVVSLYEAGESIPASKLGVLESVARLMERSEDHQAALVDVPLTGFGTEYLQAIATVLVASGGVQISETKARSSVSMVARRLQEAGQIGTPPDQSAVLSALCSHHVLERSAYPDVTYSFIHQQFQELFAALHLKTELAGIASNHVTSDDFVKKFINEPAWAEPLEMLAEYIGKSSSDISLANAVAMGSALVLMTLPVDAVFAGKLARLCGPETWREVAGEVSGRLRQLYGSTHEVSRDVGLAAMVATGSEDFKDVLLPMLAGGDASSRMQAFRTGEQFHLSSLSTDWEKVVQQWSEEARVSFVVEMTHHGHPDAAVTTFALQDQSSLVRKGYLSHVWWNMSSDEVSKLADTLTDEQFKDLILGLPFDYIPGTLCSRAATLYVDLGKNATDVETRFHAWRRASALGAFDTAEPLMQALSEMDATQLRGIDSRRLRTTLQMLKGADADWVSGWVVGRILSGALSSDEWMSLVDGISTSLRDELLVRANTEDLIEKRIPGIIPLLRQFADPFVVRSLFVRLCELLPIVAAWKPGDLKKEEADQARQIEGLLRDMPPQMVVETILTDTGTVAPSEVMNAVGEIFHIVGRSKTNLREGLLPDVRTRFLHFLKNGIDPVLERSDASGQTKAHFATVIAQVGDASDLPDIERLLVADLVRYRAERAARLAGSVRPRGRRNP